MKRKIFLSFRPEFFRPILYDIKKYEYRKRFCKEPVTAYLYLSYPVQEVVGVMELGKPLFVLEEILKYEKGTDIYKRINENIENGELYAIPIESLQLYKKPISIKKLKEIDYMFSAPRSYLNIEKFPKILDYLNNEEMYEKEFYNKHESIYEDNFCMSCAEMEKTLEYKNKDTNYLENSKYDIIKSGYINKKTNI